MRVHLLTLAIALLFAALAMRGALSSDVTWNDQARHAMNGVVLHDLIRDGAWRDPISYYKSYFARYPSLSLPYHPPLFPAVEALFFAAFGVSHFSARLTVAMFVFGVAILLFHLVFRTHNSAPLAASVTVLFLSVPLTQRLSADVMLEMPALFFSLSCLICIRGCETAWSTRRAIGAGLLCFAAIWVKQTVFLALIPAFLLIGHRRWSLMVRRPFLIFTSLSVAGAASLAWLWYKAGLTGFATHWGGGNVLGRVQRALDYYSGALPRPFLLIALLGAATAGVLVARTRHGAAWKLRIHPLYVAWVASVLVVLLIVPAQDFRYLWFIYAPSVVLCLALVHQLANRPSMPPVFRWLVPAIAAICFVMWVNTPLHHLNGPSEAARAVLKHCPQRVLVGSASNGSIIFALRAQCPRCEIVVIRADKLPPEYFQPSRFDEVAHRLGIEMIVIEKTRQRDAWTYLLQWPTRHMQLDTTVRQTSTNSDWDGDLVIFRYLNPSPSPEPVLSIPILSSGKSIDVRL